MRDEYSQIKLIDPTSKVTYLCLSVMACEPQYHTLTVDSVHLQVETTALLGLRTFAQIACNHWSKGIPAILLV